MEIFSAILLLCIFLKVFISVYQNRLFKGVEYDYFFSKDEVFEGDEIEFTEIVTNRKFLPVPWLKSELTVSSYLEFSELQSVVTNKTRYVTSFFTLRSFSRIRRTWKVKCTHRGVFKVEKIIVSATDTLGFVKDYFVVDENVLEGKIITVLPVCEEYDGELSDTGLLSGDIFTRSKLISDPFFLNGIRDYCITDSMKNINWYASAKEQKLMVNKYDYTTDMDLAVILNVQSTPNDFSDVVYSSHIEKCIRICAAVIRDNCCYGKKVRILSNGITDDGYFDVCSGDEYSLYRELAGLNLQPGTVFEKYLVSKIPELSESEVIVISAFRTDVFDLVAAEYPDTVFVFPDITGGEIS